MSRAYKGIEVSIYGKVSERSAGVDNVAYVREKLKTMKMADFVRYMVSVARRYESGDLFGSEVRKILSELPVGGAAVAEPSPAAARAPEMEPVAAAREERPSLRANTDNELINDLLDSIQGLD